MIHDVMDTAWEAFKKALQQLAFLHPRVPLNNEAIDIEKLVINEDLVFHPNDSL